jgi:hypothetical protein
MKARDFCFWLQGYFELNPSNGPMSSEQQEMVKTHLALVFRHDPDFTGMEHLAPGVLARTLSLRPRKTNTGETLLC